MDDSIIKNQPENYTEILRRSEEMDFTMPSDLYIGALLKTLISSKRHANVLELGTGASLSLAWMVDGLSQDSYITSVDNDQELSDLARTYFQNDQRVEIVCEDGAIWLQNYIGDQFDLIFADAWPGKYDLLDETLELVKVGGMYVIDDMDSQPNWPEGHEEKALALVDYLDQQKNFNLTKMNWSTGVIIATRTY